MTGLKMKHFGAHRAPLQRVIRGSHTDSPGFPLPWWTSGYRLSRLFAFSLETQVISEVEVGPGNPRIGFRFGSVHGVRQHAIECHVPVVNNDVDRRVDLREGGRIAGWTRKLV